VAFREIKEEKDLFDCTLSCGVRQLKAHKLILSACSPFFRTILRQNQHQHPLLYLKGVEYSDLQAVLDFMYHGEVNVAQEELNSFLAVAEDLQVKGLTQNTSDSRPPDRNNQKEEAIRHKSYLPREDPKPPPQPPAPKNPSHHQIGHPVSQSKPQDDYVEVVKQEPQPISSNVQAVSYSETEYSGQLASVDEIYTEEYEDYGYEGGMGVVGYEDNMGLGSGNGQQEEQINKGLLHTTILENGSAQCNICGKMFGRKDNCVRHITTVHLEASKPDNCECTDCNILKYEFLMMVLLNALCVERNSGERTVVPGILLMSMGILSIQKLVVAPFVERFLKISSPLKHT